MFVWSRTIHWSTLALPTVHFWSIPPVIPSFVHLKPENGPYKPICHSCRFPSFHRPFLRSISHPSTPARNPATYLSSEWICIRPRWPSFLFWPIFYRRRCLCTHKCANRQAWICLKHVPEAWIRHDSCSLIHWLNAVTANEDVELHMPHLPFMLSHQTTQSGCHLRLLQDVVKNSFLVVIRVQFLLWKVWCYSILVQFNLFDIVTMSLSVGCSCLLDVFWSCIICRAYCPLRRVWRLIRTSSIDVHCVYSFFLFDCWKNN